MNNHPLIIGGKDDTMSHFEDGIIFNLSSEHFEKCHATSYNIKMLEKRANAASLVLNHNTLWVVGGTGGYHSNDTKTSTEFITVDLPVERGPYLPFTITGKLQGHPYQIELFKMIRMTLFLAQSGGRLFLA